MKELFTKQQAFELGSLYLGKQLSDLLDEYTDKSAQDKDMLKEIEINQKMVDNFKIEEFDNAISSELDGMDYNNGQTFYMDKYMDENKVPCWELEDIKSLVESYQEIHRENFENEE
ncbi:MAG: hypothetical protein PHE09_18975 [Oscillospiraceae bacterium]|nr:hypothetical protein [Oscillospiraceae bacterium]